MILQIEAGGADNSALLGESNLVRCASEILPGTVLDLHESNDAAITDNEVYFSQSAMEIAINDLSFLLA